MTKKRRNEINKMNMPGFTADASFYRSSNYYRIQPVEVSSQGSTVEAALMRNDDGLTCTGSCPAGQLLINCDKHCACCIGGGRCTLNGDVSCDKNPAHAPGGFVGSPVFSTGSAKSLRGM